LFLCDCIEEDRCHSDPLSPVAAPLTPEADRVCGVVEANGGDGASDGARREM
jgi:hypothetical protein